MFYNVHARTVILFALCISNAAYARAQLAETPGGVLAILAQHAGRTDLGQFITEAPSSPDPAQIIALAHRLRAGHAGDESIERIAVDFMIESAASPSVELTEHLLDIFEDTFDRERNYVPRVIGRAMARFVGEGMAERTRYAATTRAVFARFERALERNDPGRARGYLRYVFPFASRVGYPALLDLLPRLLTVLGDEDRFELTLALLPELDRAYARAHPHRSLLEHTVREYFYAEDVVRTRRLVWAMYRDRPYPAFDAEALRLAKTARDPELKRDARRWLFQVHGGRIRTLAKMGPTAKADAGRRRSTNFVANLRVWWLTRCTGWLT